MTLQQQLDFARAKYFEMISGQTVRVFVDQNGERVEYKAGDIDKLASYIRQLEFKVDPTSQAGPMGIALC
jgi:hypothetical protein